MGRGLISTPAEIKEARQSLGLTQAQLAPLLGYGPAKARISELERGARPVTAAAARLLAAYLAGYRPPDWPKGG